MFPVRERRFSSKGPPLVFLVGAIIEKSARLLQWLVFFSSDDTAHHVCTVLAQTLFGIG